MQPQLNCNRLMIRRVCSFALQLFDNVILRPYIALLCLLNVYLTFPKGSRNACFRHGTTAVTTFRCRQELGRTVNAMIVFVLRVNWAIWLLEIDLPRYCLKYICTCVCNCLPLHHVHVLFTHEHAWQSIYPINNHPPLGAYWWTWINQLYGSPWCYCRGCAGGKYRFH